MGTDGCHSCLANSGSCEDASWYCRNIALTICSICPIWPLLMLEWRIYYETQYNVHLRCNWLWIYKHINICRPIISVVLGKSTTQAHCNDELGILFSCRAHFAQILLWLDAYSIMNQFWFFLFHIINHIENLFCKYQSLKVVCNEIILLALLHCSVNIITNQPTKETLAPTTNNNILIDIAQVVN